MRAIDYLMESNESSYLEILEYCIDQIFNSESLGLSSLINCMNESNILHFICKNKNIYKRKKFWKIFSLIGKDLYQKLINLPNSKSNTPIMEFLKSHKKKDLIDGSILEIFFENGKIDY
jgi:hypothetical protein